VTELERQRQITRSIGDRFLRVQDYLYKEWDRKRWKIVLEYDPVEYKVLSFLYEQKES